MRYSTFLLRIFAAFIDGAIFFPVRFLINRMIDSYPPINQYLLLCMEVSFILVVSIYRALLHMHSGQTLGKKFVGVKVLDISEQRKPTFRQSFVREIDGLIHLCLYLVLFVFFVISGQDFVAVQKYGNPGNLRFLVIIFLFVSIGWIIAKLVVALSNFKKRTVHDYVANTVVVRLPNDAYRL